MTINSEYSESEYIYAVLYVAFEWVGGALIGNLNVNHLEVIEIVSLDNHYCIYTHIHIVLTTISRVGCMLNLNILSHDSRRGLVQVQRHHSILHPFYIHSMTLRNVMLNF